MAYRPHSVGSHRMPRQTVAPVQKIRTPRSSAKRSSSIERRSSVIRKTPSRSFSTSTRPRWTISRAMGLPGSPMGSITPNRWGVAPPSSKTPIMALPRRGLVRAHTISPSNSTRDCTLVTSPVVAMGAQLLPSLVE